jgi:acetyl esterase/lipase
MTGVERAVDRAVERVQAVYRGWRRDTPVAQMRADWDRLFSANVLESELEPVSAGGVPSLWVAANDPPTNEPPTNEPPTSDPATAVSAAADHGYVLLYFHGGGYKLGSVRSHRDLMARLSRAARCRVLGVGYRLAPEHHFPAPVTDALAAYAWVLAQGVPPARIAFAGDSAGGGLAAAALLAARERAMPQPAAAVLLSAWTDLTADGASYTTRAAADPIHQRAMILATARHYLGEHGNPEDPLASPLFGNLEGLPPLLLQVGDRETGLDDSTRFAAKARAAGVAVTLEIYDQMIHVFQQFPDLLPEAHQAIDSIGRFLSTVWQR